MKLEDWMVDRYGFADDIALAKELGTSQMSIYRYRMCGTPTGRIPKPEMMLKIALLTEGKVTPNDFYGIRKLLVDYRKSGGEGRKLAKMRSEGFGKT